MSYNRAYALGLAVIGIFIDLAYDNKYTNFLTLMAMFNLSLLFYLKVASFLLFAVAYKRKVPNCLAEEDEIFAEAYVFVKPLLLLETLTWGFFPIFALIMLVFGLIFVCVFFLCKFIYEHIREKTVANQNNLN